MKSRVRQLFLGIIVFGFIVGLASFYFRPVESFAIPIEDLPEGRLKTELLYGRSLILETPRWIGPEGSVLKNTKSMMSCSQCHINGGVQSGGLPLWDTHGLYPQYRARENRILTVGERINTCIVMTLQGSPLPLEGREIQAMTLYVRHLGAGREVLLQDKDNRLPQLRDIDRPASVSHGEKVYQKYCLRCHGQDGQGVLAENKKSYLYPPLWGEFSYRIGSSLFRNTMAARFIKANMPQDKIKTGEQLSDEEALDVAAFINDLKIHPRSPPPNFNLFPHLEHKPFDYPLGPYVDHFSEEQHRLGPFQPIREYYEQKKSELGLSDGDVNAP